MRKRCCSTGTGVGTATGFTLIELLVSIVILTTGIVVVLEAFQTSLTALQETRQSLFSDLLIRQRMSHVEEGIQSVVRRAPVSGYGSFAGEFSAYRWSQHVSTDAAAAPAAEGGGSLADVTVSVWRRREADARDLSVQYYIPVTKEP